MSCICCSYSISCSFEDHIYGLIGTYVRNRVLTVICSKNASVNGYASDTLLAIHEVNAEHIVVALHCKCHIISSMTVGSNSVIRTEANKVDFIRRDNVYSLAKRSQLNALYCIESNTIVSYCTTITSIWIACTECRYLQLMIIN